MGSEKRGGVEQLSLSDASQQLLEEYRMVLPGIQALFGFQLIAVFSPGFTARLSEGMQRWHLAATALTSIAIALVMTPAAYHWQASPREVSEDFLRLSTRLLVGSMFPLAASICLELYLVGYVIVSSEWIVVLGLGLFILFITLWFLLPKRRHRADAKASRGNHPRS